MFINRIAFRAITAIQSVQSKFTDDEGQTLAEYGLIMAVIAVAIIIAAGVAFRGAITGAFGSATNCLNKASSSSSC